MAKEKQDKPEPAEADVPKPEPAEARMDEDAAALKRIEGGDTASLAAMVTKHGPALYRIARWIVGNQDDATGVVQESFLKMVQTAGEFKAADKKFTPWLYRIAVRGAMDLRLERNGRAGNSGQAGPRGADLKTIINAAVRRLPENSCAALALLTGGHMAYKEIAEVLQMPVGSVMNRIFQSRQKLWGTLASEIV